MSKERGFAKGLGIQGLAHPDSVTQAWPLQGLGPYILYQQTPQCFQLTYECITGVLGWFLIFLNVLEQLPTIFLGR